jgi:FlaA1/EpsC-like NDP-sugar epimerase
MLTSEAVELVLQAGSLGRDGEVYVLHTGAPIRMGDMAENFIRLSGLEPGVEIPIKVTGLKPGERLREELIVDDEDVTAGPHEKILVVREPHFDASAFASDLEMLRAFVATEQVVLAVDQLRSLVAPVTSQHPSTPAQFAAS